MLSIPLAVIFAGGLLCTTTCTLLSLRRSNLISTFSYILYPQDIHIATASLDHYPDHNAYLSHKRNTRALYRHTRVGHFLSNYRHFGILYRDSQTNRHRTASTWYNYSMRSSPRRSRDQVYVAVIYSSEAEKGLVQK